MKKQALKNYDTKLPEDANTSVHKAGKKVTLGSTWGAQSIKQPILDFSWGHDLWVVGLSPTSGSMLGVDPASDFLSLPLPFFSLSL